MELKHFPLVKVFEINNNIYLYDAHSNYLCEFEHKNMHWFENYSDSSVNGLSELWQKGAFLPDGLEKVICSNNDIIMMIEEHSKYVLPRKLILEITEDCNLRCAYCFNTLGSGPRKHSSTKINLPFIYKAIDQYFNVYTDKFSQIKGTIKDQYLQIAPPTFGWWGGEPLLNFEIIKESFLYIKNLPWKKYGIPLDKIYFSIVTNFTILTQDIIDFLIKNQIYLMVSLDGGEEEHDKNRKFVDGSGSFKLVKKNLDNLLKNYPEYCKHRIIIQAVHTKGTRKATDINSFFHQYFYDSNGEKRVLKISQYPRKDENEFISAEWISEGLPLKERQLQFEKLLADLKLLSDNELHAFFYKNQEISEEFEQVYILEELINCNLIQGYRNFSKSFACPLGFDSVYVSAKGEYHICMKTDSSMPIGNISEGIDKDKMVSLYESYMKVLEMKCKNCWNIHFCKMCPAKLMHNGIFRKPTSCECEYLKESTEWNFIKYLILYNNDDLFIKIKKHCFDNGKTNFLNYHYPVFINHNLHT